MKKRHQLKETRELFSALWVVKKLTESKRSVLDLLNRDELVAAHMCLRKAYHEADTLMLAVLMDATGIVRDGGDQIQGKKLKGK